MNRWQLHPDHPFHGGWNPQRPDHRDREFLPTQGRLEVQQTEFALDITGIPRMNQLKQGACTGHGGAGLVMYDQKTQGQSVVVPSRSMIYFDARIPEFTTDQDAGASVRDMVAGLVKYGVVPETEFPYDDQVCNRQPSQQVYNDAKQQEALVYEAVAHGHVNQAIASGFPVVFGFVVYESFMSDEVMKTGVVPIPERGEQVIGGHCVWTWGFNSAYKNTGNNKIPPRTKACRNSWMDEGGTPWGDNGNFYLPQWYWNNQQASDHWVIRRVGPANS